MTDALVTAPEPEITRRHKVQPKRKGLEGAERIPRRQDNGYYADHLTGARLRSVTTIIGGGVPKGDALQHWAGNACTDAAIEALPELLAASRFPERMRQLRDWIRRAHTRKKDERAEIGSAVHRIIEAHVLGQPMPEELLNDPEMAPFLVHFLAFVEDWQVTFTASEMVVANPEVGYAGTLDYMVRSAPLSWSLREKGYDAPPDLDLMGDTKGLALDTSLPTPTGWTTMGEVQVGDDLLDSAGLPCKVTEVSEIHERDCYRVTFDDRSSVVCDDEHLWLVDSGVQAGQIERRVTSTVDLRANMTRYGQRQHRVPVAEPLALRSADLLVEPYVLGVWLGDGKHTSAEISCSPDDGETFDHIEACGYWVGPVQRKARPSDCDTRSVLGLVGQLRMIGVLGNKHIPAAYLRGSIRQRHALLQGLMDSDGTWNRPRKCAQFVSSDKAFAASVYELIISLGHRARMYEASHTGFKPGVHYVITFTPRDGLSPFALGRKCALVTVQPARAKRRLIYSIEPTLTVPTKCIAVDSPDRTYLCTESMVPTHNTGGTLDRVLGSGHIHGVYPEAGLQMSAYRSATECWLRSGERVPMPPTASVGIVLHLRPEGYRVYPALCGDDVFRYFRYAMVVDEFTSKIASAKADRPIIGPAMALPTATDRERPDR